MKHKLLHLQSLATVALCVIMATAFISCSGDDEEPVNNSIVGTWRLSLSYSAGVCWYCQYHFMSDGTLEVKDWESTEKEPTFYPDKGFYSISNSDISLTFYGLDFDAYTVTYRFAIDGNKLIMYDYEVDGPNIFYRM